MRIRLLLAIAGAAVGAVLVAPAPASADATPFIIGGSTVTSAPWSAQIYRSGSFTCSGSIIAPTYVLTARHCTASSGMTVRVGAVVRGQGTLANVVQVSARFDLAVLRLDRSINTSYVTLATADPPVGATNSIYGWGMTCFSGCSAATQLKTASVRVSGFTTDAYGGRAIASTRINGNAWRGDSGGPQFYNGRQVGVASTADGRTRQNYGSVANSRAWITSVSGV